MASYEVELEDGSKYQIDTEDSSSSDSGLIDSGSSSDSSFLDNALNFTESLGIGAAQGLTGLAKKTSGVARWLQDAGFEGYNALAPDSLDISDSPTWLDRGSDFLAETYDMGNQWRQRKAHGVPGADTASAMTAGLAEMLPTIAMTGPLGAIPALSALSGGGSYVDDQIAHPDERDFGRGSRAGLTRAAYDLPANALSLVGLGPEASMISRAGTNMLGNILGSYPAAIGDEQSRSIIEDRPSNWNNVNQAFQEGLVPNALTGAILPLGFDAATAGMRKAGMIPSRVETLPTDVNDSLGQSFSNLDPIASDAAAPMTKIADVPAPKKAWTLNEQTQPEPLVKVTVNNSEPVPVQQGSAVSLDASDYRVGVNDTTTIDGQNFGTDRTYGDVYGGDSSVLGLQTQEVPLASLRLSSDVPQWKTGANEQGLVEPLKGSFDRRGVAPIMVWERLDGSKEVISGRHRLDLAARSGEQTIPAQILKESDGYTARDAVTLDAELNIRDEQGSVRDYSNYFRNSGISEAEAEARGLRSRSKGILGYDIGAKASPSVFALHQDGRISDQAAASIARAAPGNDSLQEIGASSVLAGKPIAVAVNQIRALEADYGSIGKGDQGNLFGKDDSAIRLAEAQAYVAFDMQREIADQVRSVQGAAKDPKTAGSLGVDVNDPQGVLNKIQELKTTQQKLDKWYHDPVLKEQITAKAKENLADPRKNLSSTVSRIANDETGAVSIKDLYDAGKAAGDWIKNRFTPLDKNLPEADRFFQGSLAPIRKALTQASTLDTKFGLRDRFGGFGIYDSLAARFETRNLTAADLMETGKDFFRLKAPGKVNSLLASLNERIADAKSRGLTPPVIDALFIDSLPLSDIEKNAAKSYLRLSEKATEVVNQSLKEKFKFSDPQTQANAYREIDAYTKGLKDNFYIPRRREGAYSVYGEDPATGKKIYYATNSKAEANALKKKLTSQGKSVKAVIARSVDPMDFDPSPFRAGGTPKDFDPNTYTKMAETQPMNGFTGHLVKADNVEGYDTDIQRSMLEYVKDLSAFSGNQKSRAMIDHIQSQVENQSPLKGYIAQKQKEIYTPPNKATQAALKLQNVMQLAGVPATALVNATQTLTTTFPKVFGESLKTFGPSGAIRASGVMGKAITQTFDSLMGGKGLPAELKSALDVAYKSGVIDAQGLNDLFQIEKRLKGGASLADKMMFMHSAAEQANRRIAFMAGWELAAAKGLQGDAKFQYAKDLVRETQFDLTAADRSSVMNHPFGRVATQFQTYAVNYLRFLRNHASLNPSKLATLGTALAVQGMIGGAVSAVPFGRILERVGNVFFGQNIDAARKALGDDKTADAILYGIPTLGGINLSGATAIGDFTGTIDKSLLTTAGRLMFGPTGNYLESIQKAKEAWDYNEPGIAAEYVSPRIVRQAMRASRAGSEGGLRDYKNNYTLKDPTTSELVSLGAGFTPERLARDTKSKAAIYDMEAQKDARPKFAEIIAGALAKGDRQEIMRVKNLVDDWNTKNPDNAYNYRDPRSAAYIEKRKKEIQGKSIKGSQGMSKEDIAKAKEIYGRYHP